MDTVIEQSRQYRPIADALEGIGGRGIEQLAGLDRIAGDRVTLAQIIEKGRRRRGACAGCWMATSEHDSKCLRLLWAR